MIKFTGNVASFYPLKVTFKDYEEERVQFTDSKKYYEDLGSKWGHITELRFSAVIPTVMQAERLGIVNSIVDDNKELNGGTYAEFVQLGGSLSELESLVPFLDTYKEEYLDHFRELKRQELKVLRDEGTASPINGIQVGRSDDRENIKGAIDNWDALLLVEGKKGWVMADNSIQFLTKAELQAIEPLYSVRKDQCFNSYGITTAQLQEAQTVEEIMEITLQLPE